MESFQNWRVSQHPSNAARDGFKIRFALKRCTQTAYVDANRVIPTAYSFCDSGVTKIAAEGILFQQRTIKIS